MKILNSQSLELVAGGYFVNNFSIPSPRLPSFNFNNSNISTVGMGAKMTHPIVGNIRYGSGSIGANINITNNISITPSLNIVKPPFESPKITGGGVSVTITY